MTFGEHIGGFCTNPRIGVLSRAEDDSSRHQITHTGLNFLSIGVECWHSRTVSQSALSETASFTCLFPCLNRQFSQGLITSETSDSYRMTLMVSGVGLLPNAPVRGFVQRTPLRAERAPAGGVLGVCSGYMKKPITRRNRIKNNRLQ